MKKIYFLILRSYAGPLIMTFFISLFVLLMQFLWKYVDDLVGKGLDWYIILQLLFYASATFVPLALPLAILLSSLMTFGNLGERYELVAIKAAGISLRKVMRPLIILSVLISIGAFYFSNNVLPLANLQFRSILYDVQQKKLAFNLKDGEYYNGIDGYVIRVQKKEKDGVTIRNVMIYDHTSGMGNTNFTMADSGRMNMSKDQRFLNFVLYHGYNFDETSGRRNMNVHPFQRTKFEEEHIKFDLSQFQLNRTNQELFKNNFEMLNLKQLSTSADSIKKELGGLQADMSASFFKGYNYLSYLDSSIPVLPDTAKALQSNFISNFDKTSRQHILDYALSDARNKRANLEFQKNLSESKYYTIRRHEIEWHRKFTLSIACLILFFIGAPFGAIIRKGGLGLPLVISVIFFVLYHVISISGEKAVRAGALPSAEGMWLASIVLLPIGIWFTYKATTDSPLLDADVWKKFFNKFNTLIGKYTNLQ
ncbi:MAG: LptF/LptG family permease [Lentimicrobiaceae bacterium]|nr:LptF/LptG family permease [Lentimicrobiaceae bacterium]